MVKKLFKHNIVQQRRKPSAGEGAIVLGITGGIACGKSLVSHLFEELGAALLSADALAREVVKPGETAYKEIIAYFGKEILSAEGTIDRSQLARRIFRAPEERQRLNQITHPMISLLADQRLCELRKRSEIPLIVYEAPLLFEAKREESVDLVLVVTTTPERQIERLLQRDKLSREDALERISAQMSLTEKMRRADIVIENSGTLGEIRKKVYDLYAQLTAFKKKNPPKAGD